MFGRCPLESSNTPALRSILLRLRPLTRKADPHAKACRPSCRRHFAVGAHLEIPQHLQQARKVKQLGLAASAVFVAIGAALFTTSGYQLPLPTPDLGPDATLAGAILLTLAGSLAWSQASQDRLVLEVHNGRLYIQWAAPPKDAPTVEAGAIEVRPAGSKGNGAFATRGIPQGSFIGDYEGELLDEKMYWHRYPNGVADYCMSIDREWTLDGRDRVKDTSRFSPVHMNHSYSKNNVVRRCSRREQRVSFYTSCDIEAGQELLLDYGKLYWTGREDKIMD